MSKVNLLITIIQKKLSAEYLEFFRMYNTPVILSIPGKGTAKDSTLDYLGIEATEKTVFFNIAGSDGTDIIARELINTMNIDIPGIGIALTVPLDSIDSRTLAVLSPAKDTPENDTNSSTGKEADAMNATANSLIITIVNQGYTDLVMNAARAAGARGGTTIHAKGTVTKEAEKFFGISISDEKELIFIVTDEESRRGIMKAIATEAGPQTKAQAMIISLPCERVTGGRNFGNSNPSIA